MEPGLRIAALDVGDKTVGVAVSDELEITANPRVVLRRDGSELPLLARLVEEEEIGEIIVGMPISLNGSIGPQAEKVLAFTEELKKQISVPVRTWDERLSTVEAEKLLIAADTRRAQRRKVVDKLAATLVLQSYLAYRAGQRGKADE